METVKYYAFPAEIRNARCAYLNNADTLYVYPNLRTRQTWIRSGSSWYKTATITSTGDYNITSYTCLDTSKVEYEYGYIYPIWHFIALTTALSALFFAFYLVIYKIFRGGMKW